MTPVLAFLAFWLTPAAQGLPACEDPAVIAYIAKAYPDQAAPRPAEFSALPEGRRSDLCVQVQYSREQFREAHDGVKPDGSKAPGETLKEKAERIAIVYRSWLQSQAENPGREQEPSPGNRPSFQYAEARRLLLEGSDWRISRDPRVWRVGTHEVFLPNYQQGYFQDFFAAVDDIPAPRFREEAAPEGASVAFALPSGGSEPRRIYLIEGPKNADNEEKEPRVDLPALEAKVAALRPFITPAHEPDLNQPFHCLIEFWPHVVRAYKALEESPTALDFEALKVSLSGHGKVLDKSGGSVATFKNPFAEKLPFGMENSFGPQAPERRPDARYDLASMLDRGRKPSGLDAFRRMSEGLRTDDFRPQIKVKYPNVPVYFERDPADGTPMTYGECMRRYGGLEKGDMLVFYEPSGGPLNFLGGGDLGHTGVGYVDVDQEGRQIIKRRDPAWGDVGSTTQGFTMDEMRFGVKNLVVYVLPNHKRKDGKWSGDEGKAYFDAKKADDWFPAYCSTNTADVVKAAGWSVGDGTTPGLLVDSIEEFKVAGMGR